MQFVTNVTLTTSASHVDSGGAKKTNKKNMNLFFRFHHNFIERLFTPDTLTSASPSACFSNSVSVSSQIVGLMKNIVAASSHVVGHGKVDEGEGATAASSLR